LWSPAPQNPHGEGIPQDKTQESDLTIGCSKLMSLN
jgi:hypothetical protein